MSSHGQLSVWHFQFGTEAESAVNLASMPQHFDLEMYVELRGQKVRAQYGDV